MRPVWLAMGMAALLSACGRDAGERSGSDSLPADTAFAGDLGPAAAAADTGCPLTLPWRSCSLLDRLERAGLAPQNPRSVRQPFFSAEGVTYELGDGELQAFIFPDSATAATEVAALDSARVAPPRTMITWRRRPTLLASRNLVVILLSDDERQIDRVSLAIGGGLPAPP